VRAGSIADQWKATSMAAAQVADWPAGVARQDHSAAPLGRSGLLAKNLHGFEWGRTRGRRSFSKETTFQR
jgi:hypothetical protein